MLNDEALDTLFRKARTHRAWLDKPVRDELLRQLYDLMKFGPTSGNCCPARIVFVRTKEAKERLRPALEPGNVDKTMSAPVTAIVAYDLQFYDKLAKLSTPAMRDLFADPRGLSARLVSAIDAQGPIFRFHSVVEDRDGGVVFEGFDAAEVDADGRIIVLLTFGGAPPSSLR